MVMTEEKKNLVIFGVVVGLMILGTVGVWAAATFWPSKKTDQVAQTSPSPTATGTTTVKLSPSPASAASPLPSPSPSPKISPSPTPKPSVSPKPSVTPSPQPSVSPSPKVSPSPSPTADIDLNLEKAVFSLNKCEAGSTTVNITHESTVYEYPSSSNYCVNGIEIRNNGHEAASSIEVKILLDGVARATATIDKIEAGTLKTSDLKFNLPSEPGRYTLQVKVNPDKKVGETRYDNNEVSMNYKFI